MNKSFIILLMGLCINLYGADTKVKKVVLRYNKSDTKEIFTVLKDNDTVRHGAYKMYVGSQLLVEGFYFNNSQSGVWRYYDYFSNDLLRLYDFDKDSLLLVSSEPSVRRCKIKLNGQWQIVLANSLPFPVQSDVTIELARQLIAYGLDINSLEGKLVLGLHVDEAGNLVEAKTLINTSSFSSEYLLTRLKMCRKWHPAVFSGNKVECQYLVYIKF